MIGLLCFAFAVQASPFKSKLRLEAAFRHQLIVLRRKLRGRVRLAKQRSLVLGPALSLVPVYPSGSCNHPPRDAHPLAPVWLSLLLALEVTIFGRSAADRDGTARVDPADEHRKSAWGRATHPRRTSQAWV